MEDLNATIWQFNLQNLSPQVLSFESKMNDLKSQETKIRKVLSDAQKIEQTIEILNELQVKAQASLDQTLKDAEESGQTLAIVTVHAEKASGAERDALASVSVIQAHQTEIAAAAATVRETSAGITIAKEHSADYVRILGDLKADFESLTAGAEQLVSTTAQTLSSAQEDFKQSFESLKTSTQNSVEQLVGGATEKVDTSIAGLSKEMKEAIEEAETNYATLEKDASTAELAREKMIKAQIADSTKEFDEAKAQALENFKMGFDLLKAGAETNISNHDEEAEKLEKRLAELEGRIHDSIERATGFTLFHSFQKRQEELKRSKYIWAGALLFCVLISGCLSWLFIHSLGTIHEFNPLFFMKLSISLPIIFAITFCSVQYSKERRLEEEYAFKSNISISLEPYQRLVGTLVDQANAEEKAKYTAFIISSINRVFTSPTGLVFDNDEIGGETANNLLKTAGNVAEALVKTKLK